MIDSHCHLDHDPLISDLDEVLNRANINGIKYLLTISTCLNSYKKILIIIKKYKQIFGTLGVHPHETRLYPQLKKNDLINLKKKENKIIGIGETGLDYYYKNSDKKIQQKLFIEHIEAAIELNLPIIVHSREAEDDTLNILSQYKSLNPKILMHCFTGSKIFAKKLLEINAYFSFSGIITFKNALALQQTVEEIPNNKILIETDSPFLAPVPMRGSKNEPSFIKYTAQKLAEIKKIDINEAILLTTNNFCKLFQFKL